MTLPFIAGELAITNINNGEKARQEICQKVLSGPGKGMREGGWGASPRFKGGIPSHINGPLEAEAGRLIACHCQHFCHRKPPRRLCVVHKAMGFTPCE